MSEVATAPEITPPLTVGEAARRLNVSEATVYRLAGLTWLEYQGAGKRKIRRITAESVQRLLEGA